MSLPHRIKGFDVKAFPRHNVVHRLSLAETRSHVPVGGEIGDTTSCHAPGPGLGAKLSHDPVVGVIGDTDSSTLDIVGVIGDTASRTLDRRGEAVGLDEGALS